MISIQSPENELLICLASPLGTAGQPERLRALLEVGLDWEYVLVMAHRHSVVQVLYQRLNTIGPQAVPPAVLARLRTRNNENAQQTLLLIGSLHKLMDRLQVEGIPAVPFKGPTLALRAYGDVALRQFGDVDILVRRHDVLRVKQLLAGLGFRPIPELTPAQEAALLRFDCAYNFGNDQRVLFDVHWQFAPRYLSVGVDLERLWGRLDSITLNEREVPDLSAEDLLPVLCLHGATHAWERLGWIADVAGLISRDVALDWPRVFAEQTALGNQRILALGLRLAKELLHAPLPDEVWHAVRGDDVVGQLAAGVKQRLFTLEPENPGLLNESRMQLRMKERRRDRLKSAFRLLATPRSFDWMPLPLPAPLAALYYPWRPLRLAAKYGLRLLQSSSKSAEE